VVLGCGPRINSQPIKPVDPTDLTSASPMQGEVSPLDAASEAEGTLGIVQETETVEIDGRSFTEGREVLTDGSEIEATREIRDVDLPVGVPYPIESLVGQINGRPVYAEEFLLPLEDRILRIVSEQPLANAARDIDMLVVRRFREFVDSELIIAEAESKLSVDQQQGVLAWLRSVQEDTIAGRGGTRDTASASIEEEFGLSFEEFLAERRSVALAGDLLRKRVQPRAIVSWRDIEQAYRRNYALFNPRPVLRIGRIRFNSEREAEKIKQVETLIADGGDLASICLAMEIPEEGFWLEMELPKDGLAGTSLIGAVKSRLEGLEPGQLSEPWAQTSFVSWFSVLSIERPPGRTIYEPSVQFALESELSNVRLMQEQERYLDSLKDRWVSADIEEMRRRLLAIARLRYLVR
jgi:hypothetical protein